MTKPQFAGVIAYIAAAIGKELSPAALDVYFDLLGDMTEDVGYLAAKRVLLEHRWATFPSVAELREAAVLSVQGEVSALSSAEAWQIAWKAASRIDLDIDGSKDRALKNLPPLVVEAMDAFGLAALTGGSSPVEVMRAQFVKIFDQLAARQKRLALLPPKTFTAIVNARPKEVLRLADAFALPQ